MHAGRGGERAVRVSVRVRVLRGSPPPPKLLPAICALASYFYVQVKLGEPLLDYPVLIRLTLLPT